MFGTPESICPDFPEWPKRWEGVKEDVPYGQALLETFRPFVAHLVAKGLSNKVIRKHMDNLWLLGGEIIRDVSMNEEYDSVSPADKLKESVSPAGGLSCRHLTTDAEITSYMATCRGLDRFLRARPASSTAADPS